MRQKTILLAAVMILMIILIPVAEAASLGSRPLSFGNNGDDVKELQARLSGFGYYWGPLSGRYGQQTERAVIRFQQNNNLRIDGISDWRTINSLTSKQYRVRSNDNLSSIARRFDTTANAIRNWNSLNSNLIHPGRRLTIPHSNSIAQINSNRQATGVTQNSSSYKTNITNEEFELLTRAVYSEARGESYQGQVAIAAVVLNRVEDSRFPNTVRGVIFEPWAFTAVHDGQFWLQPDGQARNATKDALNGKDPTGGAAFYYNPITATSQWMFDNMRSDVVIGKHHFSRN